MIVGRATYSLCTYEHLACIHACALSVCISLVLLLMLLLWIIMTNKKKKKDRPSVFVSFFLDEYKYVTRTRADSVLSSIVAQAREREMTNNNYTLSLNLSDFPHVANCRGMHDDAGIVFGTVAESLWMVAMMIAAFGLALGGASFERLRRIRRSTRARVDDGEADDVSARPSSPPFPSLG